MKTCFGSSDCRRLLCCSLQRNILTSSHGCWVMALCPLWLINAAKDSSADYTAGSCVKVECQPVAGCVKVELS